MEPEVKRVIDRILQDANEKAKSIVHEAQKSAEISLENQRQLARKKAEEDERVLMKKSEIEIKTIKGRALSDAKRKADWTVLSEKERLITNVLNEAKKRLAELSKSEKYTNLLEKMIVDAGTALKGSELEVLLNEYSASLPLKMKQLAEAVAKKTRVETQFRLSKDKIESLGAIVRTVDGKIIADNTFDAILKRREKELRLKTAKILFKD